MKAGWKTVKLGEVARYDKVQGIHSGLPYVGLEHIESGTRKFIGSRSDMEVQSSSFLFNPHHVLYGRLRPYLRKVLVPDFAGHCSTEIFPILPSSDLDRSYLSYWLIAEFTTSAIDRLCNGARMPRANMEQALELEIPLPPLAEQKRIVALLDEAFAGIDEATAKAEANIRDAEILFESYLQSVFHDQEQGWEQKRLGDLVTRLTNGYVGPTRNIYQESGVPYLLARHVKNNRLNFDGRTFISQEFNLKNKKSLLKTGDVLLVQSGHIGHCAVVTDEHDGHNCHAMIVITATKGSFIGPFLSLFFNSSGMKRKFEQIRSGSTVPHLTCGEIRELMIPLPTIEIQKDIVERAKVLDEYILQLRSNLANRLSAYDEFKRSLLIQAFAGELTA